MESRVYQVSEESVESRLFQLLAESNKYLAGKSQQVKLSLCSLFARGHVLIEDAPGVGKTTLVKFLSRVLGLDVQRIQFTNDMLPSDILGVSIFNQNDGSFEIKKGPLFSNLIIADELNRASPKTQSAFLQAMEENCVTIEGKTFELSEPFFVVATQNPVEHAGTFPLPDSQLDRFLIRFEMGYPTEDHEKELLKGSRRAKEIESLGQHLDGSEILDIQKKVDRLHVSESIVSYVYRLLQSSRSELDLDYGLSPRAGIALVSAAKAWAYIEGREMVLPEDVQAVAVSVMSHRLSPATQGGARLGAERASKLLNEVSVD